MIFIVYAQNGLNIIVIYLKTLAFMTVILNPGKHHAGKWKRISCVMQLTGC